MDNLIVTAHLLSPIAVNDDWSPHLDALLEWQILERHGLVVVAPTIKQITATRNLVNQEMPLAKGWFGKLPYWQISSPCYEYLSEYQERFRKRWAPGIDTPPPNWGKRRANINTSAGAEKNYDLPLRVRLVEKIHWFCVGDRQQLQDLLNRCTHLGKKRAYGYGQVYKWSVEETAQDYHLYTGTQVRRPIPLEWLQEGATDYTVLKTRVAPPYWLLSKQVLCAMPTGNVCCTTAIDVSTLG